MQVVINKCFHLNHEKICHKSVLPLSRKTHTLIPKNDITEPKTHTLIPKNDITEPKATLPVAYSNDQLKSC